MEVCPECSGIAYFNSHFQRKVCTRCRWVGPRKVNHGLKTFAVRREILDRRRRLVAVGSVGEG